MKVTTGGNIGFKIIAKPYEPIDVNVSFLLEEDFDTNDPKIEELVNKLSEKVNKILEEQLKKKVNIAFKVYKEARGRLSEINGN